MPGSVSGGEVSSQLHPEAVREVDAPWTGMKASARAWEPNSSLNELRLSFQVIAEAPRANPPGSGGRARDVEVRRLLMERFFSAIPKPLHAVHGIRAG